MSEDQDKAYLLLEQAAENGSPYAQYHLGSSNMSGIHVTKDEILGFKFF